MINCYAITPKEKLSMLMDYCSKYPLTELKGSINTQTSVASVLALGTNVLFVDDALKKDYKPILDELSSYVAMVYLSDDAAVAFAALEEGALDLLIYPFSFSRFERCMSKLLKLTLMNLPRTDLVKTDRIFNESFFVKSGPKDKMDVLIQWNDVLFIKAGEKEVAIQMVDGRKFVCLNTMKEMEDYLSEYFIRVHKSYIINWRKLTAFDGANIIMEANTAFKIPLGGAYRKSFLSMCNAMMVKKPNKNLSSPMLKNALSLVLVMFTFNPNCINELFFV